MLQQCSSSIASGSLSCYYDHYAFIIALFFFLCFCFNLNFTCFCLFHFILCVSQARACAIAVYVLLFYLHTDNLLFFYATDKYKDHYCLLLLFYNFFNSFFSRLCNRVACFLFYSYRRRHHNHRLTRLTLLFSFHWKKENIFFSLQHNFVFYLISIQL